MENKVEEIYNYLVQKKCKDIAVYDLSGEESDSEYLFVITTANQALNKKFAASVMVDFGVEKKPDGYDKGEWIVFDFDKYIIHSFIPQVREKYNLDKLWKSKRLIIKKQSKK